MVSRAYVGGRWAYTPADAVSWYRPVFADDPWYIEFRPTLEQLVAAIEPPTPAAAFKSMHAASYYARFLRTNDVPLVAERMFTPENVDWYVSTELARYGEHSRSTQRGALRQIGLAVTRRAGWKSASPQFRRTAAAEPYSADEQRDFRSLVDHQATPARRRLLAGLVAAGLGAGLRGQELQNLRATDVERDEELVFVRVRGDRPRRVPVRREHAFDLLQLALDHPQQPLLGAFKPTQKNPLSSMKSHLEVPERLPPLELRRLRAT